MRCRLTPDQTGAFTLVELVVTLLIVGICLTLLQQGMLGTKLVAQHTYHEKMAKQLALYTLGQIESGLYWEERLEAGLSGDYAEQGFEDFSYTVLLGENSFSSTLRNTDTNNFDTWLHRDELAFEDSFEDDREEEEDLAYEKVKVQVVFPPLADFKNELILERWVPWEQVYGPSEEDLEAGP